MRTFIAIDFERDLKRQISMLQAFLRPCAVKGRWKREDNFHLTLKFLGETDDARLKNIDTELESFCSDKEQFTLKISELGFFPGDGCLRVLWIGLDGDMDKLSSLQKGIDEKLVKYGFEKEKRKYSPHVTIAQDVIFKSSFDNIKALAGKIDFDQIRADKIHLFKSEQVGSKRVYTPIHEYSLGK